MSEHRYVTHVDWTGSTGIGYETYDRTHTATARPAQTTLVLSSDSSFRGDASKLNPEQLVVLAASSRQLLSFLAIAARARVDVIAYRDEAEGVMPEDDPPVRLTEIRLRPRISVATDTPLDRVLHYVELAHRECYIANSVKTKIHIEPEIIFTRGTRD
jgi:organic hydroperoxide reductase OsmC/OhrA